jgi:hypothetical protein
MIGLTCDWRMTWTNFHADEFGFVNEERNEDGSWAYINLQAQIKHRTSLAFRAAPSFNNRLVAL